MEIATAFVTIRPQIDGFESELAAAVGGIEQPVTLTAEADVADAEAEIDSLDGAPVEVPVDADVDTAQSEMDAWMASYFQVEVSVDADVDTAQQEIDSIEGGDVTVTVNTEGTEQAKEQIDNLAGSTGQLGEVAQGAMGGMSGLGGAAGGAAQALGTTAVGVGVLAVGVYEVAQAGIEAESAMQRFEFVTGNLGDSVSSIDVGGLSGDIGELALKIGSSDEAMLNATASFVQFAQSSGAADDQIVQASDNINALALRAAAMNPALGDAGEVSGRLAAALARGGRATRQFGIDVSTAEINARALSNTGKQNAADLTQFERAAAGAQIAVERLGTSMGADFQEGSENAALKWQRMTESFGELQEVAGGKMLPFVEDVTSAITKLNEGIQDFDLSDIASSLLDLSGPGMAINELFNFPEIFGWGDDAAKAAGNLRELPPALRESADAADEFAQAQSAAEEAIANTLPTLDGIIGQVDAAGQAFGILNASSDPQVVIDNLQNALFAWDIFQQRIATIGELGPNIAGALQQLGPELGGPLAGALVEAVHNGSLGVIGELDALIQGVEARGGDVSAVLTGFAQGGMSGAVAAVGDAAPAMGAAAEGAGRAGAAGIDAGLATTAANVIGQGAGVSYGAGTLAGLGMMAGSVSAVANSLLANAGSTSSAFSRGQALGISYGAGIVAGLAGQVGAVAANRALLDATAAEMGRALGRDNNTAAPVSNITLQIPLDGRVVAERVFAIDHQRGIAEGFEQ